MGFWFQKRASKAPSKPAGAFLSGGPPGKARQNATTLARLGCRGCPLDKAPCQTPKMAPTLAIGSSVYILAEAPGQNEDEVSHKPLTGPSGKLLHECIPEGERASFDNVLNCRPPDNRTPTWQEIECCRPRRVKWIEEAKPKLILGLGAVPLKFMLGSTDLKGMRGRLFAVRVGTHECWFLPTYHPAFLLHLASKSKYQNERKKPLNSRLGHCFRMDICRAFDLGSTIHSPAIEDSVHTRDNVHPYDGSQLDGFLQVIDHLRGAKQAPIKAIDIETKGLRPYAVDAAIMTVAISFGDTNFAFALDHPKTGWAKQQKMQIGELLESILRDDTIKVAHNTPFELEWFISYFGLDVVNHAAWECTQMQAQFLDERRGDSHGSDDDHRASYQSLDFLVKQHFGISYKSSFKLDKKDMSKSDLGETLIYNGVDTKFTLKLFYRQTELLKKQGLHNAYLEALPRQPSVALMQALGVSVDQIEVKHIQGILGAEVEAILSQIKSLDVVKTYIEDNGSFNPQSGPDAIKLFKDYLKCKEVSIKEEAGTRYSVDKNVLDKIDHPLARLIVQLRTRSKLKSTYCDGLELGVGSLVYPDGKIHTNFNTTFAETGRTSSDFPNLQNFPQRKDAWVRKQIVPDTGHVLVAFDYGQLEGCTAAMCSKDKALVKALWEDYDIHMDFAERVVALWPEIGSDNMDKTRSLVKNKFVFPAIFGAQAKSIAGYLNMPEHIAEELIDVLWGKYSGLKAWQDVTMRTYYQKGYVESPTGRRHNYPLTRNQVINFPIQSVACDIVCDAMNRLSYLAVQSGKWYLHPRLNIHDDLTMVIPDDDQILEEAIETIYKAMLTPPYLCVNVPLSVSVSVGKNWFEMGKIGKFWSHRDVEQVV